MREIWMFVIFVAVLAASGLGFLAAAPKPDEYWPKTSSDLAVWVQAVGSILAILFAVLLSVGERRHARDERQREAIERRNAISYDVIAAALELQVRVAKLQAFYLDQDRKGEYATEVIVMKDLLRRLGTIGTGDSPETHKNLTFEIRQLIAEVLSYAVGRSLSNSTPPNVDWVDWNERADRLFKQAALFR